jgi:hypothetical protein|uniref:Uncharacterized protein n=1 Tax=candidate division WOR-3 bacterium TaxID=2052148 RepID=A0A7C4TH55_UNCW3
MLKRVYLAQDEFGAITIKEILKGHNIKALIRRFETTWLDGLPRLMEGGWGEVLVEEKDYEKAIEYIQEFLSNPPSDIDFE